MVPETVEILNIIGAADIGVFWFESFGYFQFSGDEDRMVGLVNEICGTPSINQSWFILKKL